MSVKLYDDALLKKLRSWTLDTHITLTGVNETNKLFTTVADNKDDNPIQLPLIALTRPGGFIINDKYKQPKSYNGVKVAYNERTSGVLNAIQITIPYQIDVYARLQEEADEYIRNIVFNIVNYPNVKIEVPYHDLGITHDSSLRIDSDVEDNSDVPEQLVSGQFKRYTLGLRIDDAYLFDVRVKDNLRIVEGYLAVMEEQGSEEIADAEVVFKNYL